MSFGIRMDGNVPERSGRTLKRTLALIMSIFVLLSVPLLTAVDTEAVDSEAGYSITVNKNATYEEYSFADRADDFDDILRTFMGALNDLDFELLSVDSYSSETSYGEKVSGLEKTQIMTYAYEFDDFIASYIVTSSEPVIDGYDYLESVEKTYADAVCAYFGTDTYNVGDKIVLEGDVEVDVSMVSKDTYVQVGDKLLRVSESNEYYGKIEADIDMRYIPVSGAPKTIEIDLDVKLKAEENVSNTYSKAYSDLVDDEDYTSKTVYTTHIYKNDSKIEIDGKDYDFLDTSSLDQDETETKQVHLRNASVLETDVPMPTGTSTDNVKYTSGYIASESARDKVVDDVKDDSAKGDDSDDTALIIGIVLAVVVILLLVALVFYRRGHKV